MTSQRKSALHGSPTGTDRHSTSACHAASGSTGPLTKFSRRRAKLKETRNKNPYFDDQRTQ